MSESQPTPSTTDSSESTPIATPSVTEPVSFKLYKPSNYAAPARPALPDSYFTPSASELKLAQSSLAEKTQTLTNAPLQLRATREAEEKKKLDRWPHTTIRIRFSDRHQLERIFESGEKIKAVYAWVRGCLREDVKAIKFVLYQTPPIRELKVSDPKVNPLTLAQLQLAPSSILHVRFLEDSMNATTYAAPLDPSILAKAEDLPIPPSVENTGVTESKSDSKPSTGSSKSTSTSDGAKKIPKWFKLKK